MTITLDLPTDLERELAQEAERLGLPLAEYAIRVLAGGRTPHSGASTPLTGAELVEYWTREGILGSRADIGDPISFARELREQNQNRNRA